MKELITIVIPCRNEFDNLIRNYQMIKDLSFFGHQIIIVDDDSTDQSKIVYEKLTKFCEIYYVGKKPDKVIGKSFALCYINRYIKNQKILFLDADIKILDLKKLDRLISQVDEKTVIGVIPMFECYKFRQAFGFYFYQLINISAYLFRDKRTLFGGFYIINREFYQKIGTHQKVLYELVEDVEMAHLIYRNGGKIKMKHSRSISANMYDNISQITEGFTKNIKAGIKSLSTYSIILQIMYILLVAVLLTEFAIYSFYFYLLMAGIYYLTVETYLLTKKYYVIFWPIFFFFFIYVNFKSLLIKKKSWKDREYD